MITGNIDNIDISTAFRNSHQKCSIKKVFLNISANAQDKSVLTSDFLCLVLVLSINRRECFINIIVVLIHLI